MLWLENNRLSGSIPFQLGNSRGLQELNLYNNVLTGEIPSLLLEHQSLLRLNIASNSLTGIPTTSKDTDRDDSPCVAFLNPFDKIAKKIGFIFQKKIYLQKDAPPLETLSLANNYLEGTIPTTLAYFANLIELNLALNSLTRNIPTELGHLGELTMLDLHNNLLTGTIPTRIGEARSLEILNL